MRATRERCADWRQCLPAPGALVEAERLLRHALTQVAHAPSVWSGLSQTLLEAGRLTEAESAIRHALLVESRNPQMWIALGAVSGRLMRPEAALAAYQEAERLDPSQKLVHLSAVLATIGALSGGFRFTQAAFMQVRDAEEDEPIVGLWRFKFLAKGNKGIPDGAVIDNGVVAWHSDNTEITNSSREPITGNFCLGVWKKTGRRSYHLNHIGLSWDSTGTVFVGPASIKESVTVDSSGKTYSGRFSITQCAIDESTVLAAVKGVITGDRVSAD